MSKHANALEIDMNRLISCVPTSTYMLVFDFVQASKQAGYFSMVSAGFFGDVVCVTYPFPGDNATERAAWLRENGVPAACLKVASPKEK